jgi:hypothetical protein
MTPHNHNEA